MVGISSHDRYQARVAATEQEVVAAQRLRNEAFGVHSEDGLDIDAFDARCHHFLVEKVTDGALVATFRVLPLRSGAEISESYSAQYYDLAALRSFPGPMAELGRFCMSSDTADPEILRLAWGALTKFVDDKGIEMLFGCSSFHGTDRNVYADAFEFLRENHLAPSRFRPAVKAANVVQFAKDPRRVPDRKRALRTMPSLLRSYLSMGGWVSDHAVVDQQMNTLHVFTGLEIERIPPARARVLRAVAV